MEFLKKHYEKILLSVVLLGLGVAAAWLPMVIKQVEVETKDKAVPVSEPSPKPLPPLDLSKESVALQAVTNQPPVSLSGGHNVFNPVTWKRTSDGLLMKVPKEGPEVMMVTNIAPLFTVVSYDRPSGSGYYMSYQQQSVKKGTEFVKVDEKDKSGLFIIREVKGAPEDPSELIIEMQDTMEKASVKKGAPYQRVDGYTVDLKYDPDKRTYNKKHLDDVIQLSGKNYKIIYITNNAVRVRDIINDKPTTIPFSGTSN